MSSLRQTGVSSIDSVVDDVASLQESNRPSLKHKPSWIGPPKQPANISTNTAMKHKANIEYSSPGLQPPVYVFTSLSEPQWVPIEMDTQLQNDGTLRFSKTFEAEEGEYQYKFRLGPGDWWACDESMPLVDDGFGNKNNRIIVRAQNGNLPLTSASRNDSVVATKAMDHSQDSPAPLMKHETLAVSHEREATTDEPGEDQLLMRHEYLVPDNSREGSNNIDANSDSSSQYGDVPDEVDEEDQEPATPQRLFRHESLAPEPQSPVHPLLRHESISDNENAPASSGTPLSPSRQRPQAQHTRSNDSSPTIPVEADPNDPSLEAFPTDHMGILSQIRRTSTMLAEDDTFADDTNRSVSPVRSGSSAASLPSVHEDEEEDEENGSKSPELEKIRELEEEQEIQEEHSGRKLSPKTEEPPLDGANGHGKPDKSVSFGQIEREGSGATPFERLAEFVGGKPQAIAAVAVGIVAVVVGVASIKLS